MAEKFEKLFDQFAPVTPEEWRASRPERCRLQQEDDLANK